MHRHWTPDTGILAKNASNGFTICGACTCMYRRDRSRGLALVKHSRARLSYTKSLNPTWSPCAKHQSGLVSCSRGRHQSMSRRPRPFQTHITSEGGKQSSQEQHSMACFYTALPRSWIACRPAIDSEAIMKDALCWLSLPLSGSCLCSKAVPCVWCLTL